MQRFETATLIRHLVDLRDEVFHGFTGRVQRQDIGLKRNDAVTSCMAEHHP